MGISIDSIRNKAKDAANSALDKAKTKAKDLAKDKLNEATNKITEAAQGGIERAVAKLGDRAGALGKLPGVDLRNMGKDVSESLTKPASEALSSIAQSSRLAEPFFQTGVNDETLTRDPKGITELLNINKEGLVDRFKASSLVSSLKDSTKDLKGLLSDGLLAAVSGGSASSVLDRAKAMVGGRLKDGLTSSVIGALTGGTTGGGLIGKTVDFVAGGFTSAISPNDIGQANRLSEMFNRVTGDSSASSVNDTQTRAGLLTGMFSDALKIGASSMIENAIANSSGDPAILAAVRNSARQIAQSGETGLLDRAMGLMTPAEISESVAGMGPEIASNFSLKPGTQDSDLPGIYDSLNSTLTAVNGDWQTSSFGNTTVGNLSVFAAASPAAQTVFNSQSDLQLSMALANAHRP